MATLAVVFFRLSPQDIEGFRIRMLTHVVASYRGHTGPDHKQTRIVTSIVQVAVQGTSRKTNQLLQRICAILGYVLVYRQTLELQVFRDANNSRYGTNNSLVRTEDFCRNTASESLLRGNVYSD